MSTAGLLELLLPRPRSAAAPGGAWRAAAAVPLHLAADATDPVVAGAVERLRAALARHRVELVGVGGGDPRSTGGRRLVSSPAAGGVRLAVRDEEPAAESYRLGVSPGGVELVAGGGAGLLHGTATLCQWLRLAVSPLDGGFELAGLDVDDAPDFAHRGVLLDVSRDKVPRLAELRRRVELLSALKVNQLQLYFEHTFAYRGHEAVWHDASPLTAAEVRELDAFCRARAIELVPCQNSLGHFHRWLVHPAYRGLAECPAGVAHPWSHPASARPEPFSLCATDPGTLALLADLYDQLLPCFSAGSFNVGLDETFDLGRCRSRRACEERGRHRVYLDFVQAVHRLAAERGRRIQMWGDIVLEAPAVIPELPADAVLLDWGYEAGHPFAEQGERFAASGLEHWVCPGTSAWASLTGRTRNALANVAEAAVAGRDAGATGYLVTDWGDFGHLQPWPVSWPGLAAGAAAGWNADRPVRRDELGSLLDLHLLEAGGEPDRLAGAGEALADLGDTYRVSGGGNGNGTALFHLLLKPGKTMGEGRFASLTADRLRAAADHLQRCATAFADAVATAPLDRPDAAQIAAEVAWVAEATRFACDLGLERLALPNARFAPLEAVPAARRRPLGLQLDDLLARRRDLWLARNRPGGLDHALGWLNPLRRALAPER